MTGPRGEDVQNESGSTLRRRSLIYGPTLRSVCALQLAVIVAVTIMGVMQMAIDQVVYMIAVGHCFVSAVVAVLMCSIVACTSVTARAIRGIRCGDLKPVLIDVAIVERVQVAIVEIVGVSVMDNRSMATGRTVLMCVVSVNCVLS